MPDITVNIEIFCARCGAGLCSQTVPKINRYAYSAPPAFEVTPCQKCLDEAREEGHNDGHDEGYDEGYADGQDKKEEEEGAA